MKASDAIAHVLAANNITYGFELIGGMITHMVDSINLLGKTKLISLHHEQGAAFAAGGIARATCNTEIGLALGTSGPGATNLVTGIADCWLDGYPCIFLTGQVNTYEQKGSKQVRQQGFQELEIVEIVASITKYAYKIEYSDELIPILYKAIDLARSGRPGPVLLDIPMDIQRADISCDLVSKNEQNNTEQNVNIDSIYFQSVIEKINNAKKPLFLIGGGAVNESNFHSWQQKIADIGIPHVASLKGSEKCIAYKCYYGMIGSYGTRTANYAIQNCDLLIVLGSRLDVRQTGANIDDFARCAEIIQIDIDSAQINNRIKSSSYIQCNCKLFFDHVCSLKKNKAISLESWKLDLDKYWEKSFIDEYREQTISPFRIFQEVRNAIGKRKVHFVSDVGNNQMWAAHSLLLGNGQYIHHSGGLGAMGFAIPTAIGIASVTKSATVILTGDGGAQLNIQELDIIARENLPILTIIFNNHSLGMVRNFQSMYFDGRDESTYWGGYSSSFSDIGRAYNIESYCVSTELDFISCFKKFIDNQIPTLIDIVMPESTECRPRLTFGNPLDKQYPNWETE